MSPMPDPLPPCPHLPAARPGLDWRSLHAHRESERGAAFYLACLEYGQDLWQRRLAARSMLCLDRAFGAELAPGNSVLARWPWPYAALVWMLRSVPPEVFIGNPRVHFQHYAGRMNEPRREQRIWRAWACWALVRQVRPDLPGDPRHRIEEPVPDVIGEQLLRHGDERESSLWRQTLRNATPRNRATGRPG